MEPKGSVKVVVVAIIGGFVGAGLFFVVNSVIGEIAFAKFWHKTYFDAFPAMRQALPLLSLVGGAITGGKLGATLMAEVITTQNTFSGIGDCLSFGFGAGVVMGIILFIVGMWAYGGILSILVFPLSLFLGAGIIAASFTPVLGGIIVSPILCFVCSIIAASLNG